MTAAACRGTDWRSWFPPSGRTVPPACARTCAGCPVLAECGAEARRMSCTGVFAGQAYRLGRVVTVEPAEVA